jgi:hypothetical protein
MEADLINNTEWLAGYRAFERGEPCPWGSEAARLGWIVAKADAEADAK